MNISIPIGWWLIPALLTLAIFAWARWANSDSYGIDIGSALVYGAAIIGTLFVWLAWAIAMLIFGG